MLKRLCVFTFLLTAIACGDDSSTTARVSSPQVSGPQPQSDQGVWVKSTAGTPDEDYSSENEVPRPPIVARTITYNSKHVRVILMPEVPGKPNAMGTPPPYHWWTIVAFSDPGLSAKCRSDA